jgi:SAM-dependent methyltransferase
VQEPIAWWLDAVRRDAAAVLDVRAAACFAAGHLAGAVSWPLEAGWQAQPPGRRAEWLARRLPSIQLPPRHVPLLVVASAAPVADELAAALSFRGRAQVTALAMSPTALADLPPAAVGRGPGDRRLWRPPPFLARWRHLLPPPAAGPVLDLACGSGRAAVWLARQGWRVTGVDHQPEVLALGRELARDAGVTVTWSVADLRDPGAVPAGRWAAILLFRFLHRPLLADLPARLRPGGVLMLRTFRDAPGYIGNPRPRHRLGRDEAAGLWAGGELLVHEQGFDPDGHPAAGVVWRRVRSRTT